MVDIVNRFRPGTQQRGEDTRRRILETAFELFASDGFEGASTRTLAERAGVNLPAIQYYFGSKEGLYRAVVEQITRRMEERLAPMADRIRAELEAGQASRKQLVGLLCDQLDIVISLMLDENVADRDSQQKFFARIEVEPNPATDTMQERMIRLVLMPCTAIIGRLLDRDPDDEQVKLRAMMIIGQAKIFCGWGTSRVLHWDAISAARVRAVQALIREHVQAILRGARGG